MVVRGEVQQEIRGAINYEHESKENHSKLPTSSMPKPLIVLDNGASTIKVGVVNEHPDPLYLILCRVCRLLQMILFQNNPQRHRAVQRR